MPFLRISPVLASSLLSTVSSEHFGQYLIFSPQLHICRKRTTSPLSTQVALPVVYTELPPEKLYCYYIRGHCPSLHLPGVHDDS